MNLQPAHPEIVKKAKEIVADLNTKLAPLTKRATIPEIDYSDAGVQGDAYAAENDPYTIAAYNNESIAFDPKKPGSTLLQTQFVQNPERPGNLTPVRVPAVDPSSVAQGDSTSAVSPVASPATKAIADSASRALSAGKVVDNPMPESVAEDSLLSKIMAHVSANKEKYALGAGAAGVGALGAGLMMGGDDEDEEEEKARA